MRVELVNYCDEHLLAGVNALLPQLSGAARLFTLSELREIVLSDTTHLLIAFDGNQICGMVTLVVFRIPVGVRAWIEDVVVDALSRGKGVGQALLGEAIHLARTLGATTIDLTSNPAREAANRLYRKAGFEKRETNIYRMVL